MSVRYSDAAAKLQAKVQTYLKDNQEDVSSSDEEEPVDSSVLEGVLQNYCRERGDNLLLQRTKHLLEESLNGKNITCLICIGSIRRIDAIWNCESCYCYFHLSCIQKWANDSVNITQDTFAPISVHVPKKIEWCCPKCRHSYSKDEIPRKYRCFCGKTDNPLPHPWMVPHSCGEMCHKALSVEGSCKHRCLLLCHPGQCPPCPQTITQTCYCGGEKKPVRCSAAAWSCNKTCNKLLLCKSHKCGNICHQGECTACTFTSMQSCLCGVEKIMRPCFDLKWQCSKVCGKPYSCGYHRCNKVCHSGDCGNCPKSGMRTCPCGANKKYVTCPDDTIETCIDTCNKSLSGCNHTCSEKCHKGPCPPCLVLIDKKCNCSTHTRMLPCSREFKCDTKCNGLRLCKKHNCNKKCCNGNCPPCDKSCDKPLQCGRHKCTMVCHSGPCYPCPLESKITCRCKQTIILVPCGRERHAKPPKCNFPCKQKYKCGHAKENEHPCHFGDCPPCKAICNKKYKNCIHKCISKCHKEVKVLFQQVQKPATPCEVHGPKTKVLDLNCPPCEVVVYYKCFGEHEITEQVCHMSSRLHCGRLCGQPLSCGNHTCSLPCHLLVPDENFPHINTDCEECHNKCTKPRPENCKHRCSISSCHSGPCPPCEIHERLKCHCGLTEYYVRCKELFSVTEEFLSCKQQCTKNLECGHRCKNTCHAGPCVGQICTKKVKTYCECGNLKKELPCVQARKGDVKVSCNASCKNKILAGVLEKQEEEKRKIKMEEEKNRRELEEYENKFTNKRKYKEKKKVVVKHESNWFLNNCMITVVSVFVLVLAVLCYVFYI